MYSLVSRFCCAQLRSSAARPPSRRRSATTNRRPSRRCWSRIRPSPSGRGSPKAAAVAGPAQAAAAPTIGPRARRSAAAGRPGQCAGPRAADARWLHQRDAGLSLRGRRALPSLCRARTSHRHRAAGGRAACRLWSRCRRRHRALDHRRHRERHRAAKRVHILVKPTRPDLITNLVINTDRRTYHLELRSTEKTYMASVSWVYPQDQLIALRRQNASADAAAPVAAAATSTRSTSATRSKATRRPGARCAPSMTARKSSSSFRAGIGQGEMPPLFIVGPEGGRRARQLSRARKHMIVDRLFAAAELRLGDRGSERRVRIVRTDGRPSW